MVLNPITHENGELLASGYNNHFLVGIAIGTATHFLGNRYVWRWYSDSQVLAMHVPAALVQTLLVRITSNCFPGSQQPVQIPLSVGDSQFMTTAYQEKVGNDLRILLRSPAEGGAILWCQNGESQIVPIANGSKPVLFRETAIADGKIKFDPIADEDSAFGPKICTSLQVRSDSLAGKGVLVAMSFVSGMVFLPLMGVRRIGFWGCFIGFAFHGAVSGIPVAIEGALAAVVGVFVAVWTKVIQAPKPTGHYDTRGLKPEASETEIKKAYRTASLKWHPDKWSESLGGTKEEGEAKFKAINEANSILSDPEKRAKYDQFGMDDQSSITDWRTLVCATVYAVTDWAFKKKGSDSADKTGQTQVLQLTH